MRRPPAERLKPQFEDRRTSTARGGLITIDFIPRARNPQVHGRLDRTHGCARGNWSILRREAVSGSRRLRAHTDRRPRVSPSIRLTEGRLRPIRRFRAREQEARPAAVHRLAGLPRATRLRPKTMKIVETVRPPGGPSRRRRMSFVTSGLPRTSNTQESRDSAPVDNREMASTVSPPAPVLAPAEVRRLRPFGNPSQCC